MPWSPFEKAVEAARANGNTEQEGYSRFMLASAYCANGDYRQAIETLSPLVEAADTIPFRYFAQQVRIQNLLFHAYFGDWTPGQLLDARSKIDLDVIRTAPLSYGKAASEDTGRSFYDIASAIIFREDGQLDSARCYIEESLACRDTFHQGDVGLFDIAAGIYHGLGDDKRAYDYMQQYVSVKDSLFEVQRGAQVAELERRYRTATRWRCARRRCATGCGSWDWQPCWLRWRPYGPWSATAANCVAATSSSASRWRSWTPSASRTTASPRGSMPPMPARQP